jgi:omega-hydroxy-beta-dihydromenaquinone-9 sulfotransferase
MNLYTAIRARPRHYVHVVRGWLGYYGVFEKLNPPIFIVGAPNSGTRALAQAVSLSPDIEDRSEARVLWDKDFHLRNNDTLKTAEDVTRSDVLRLQGNFCYYQWKSGKRVVLNRHPENSLRIHFIKRIFPSAKIIHIVRDGHAVVCSNYRGVMEQRHRLENPFGSYLRPPGWRNRREWPLLKQLAYLWNATTLYASREGRKYGDDYREVFYESLPEKASSILPDIWKWLGVGYSDRTIERLPGFEDRNYKWKAELTREEVAVIEEVARKALTYFGYLGKGTNERMKDSHGDSG